MPPRSGGRGWSLRLAAIALGLVSGSGLLSAARGADGDLPAGTSNLEEIVVTAEVGSIMLITPRRAVTDANSTTTSDLFYDHTVRPGTVGVTATYRR